MTTEELREQIRKGLLVTAASLVALAVAAGLFMGGTWAFKAFNRSQRVADANNVVTTSRIKANNEVELNRIRIGTQKQRVQIAEQTAEIRLREAQGIRAAQDEISETLTPLYVQMEMVRALEGVAKSGKNATVVYIPVGPDGLPVVADTGMGRGPR